MKFLRRSVFCLIALIAFLIPAAVFADGMIIIDPPIPPDVPPYAPLAVKYHHVDVDIDANQVAKTTIDQVFKNPNDYDVEGTYFFPFPSGASISDFAMWVEGKKLEGEILEKEIAQQIYEETVRKLIDPALLEYVGNNTFKARVYPIPKKSEKQIQINYQEVLKKENNVIHYLYPLNTEKFSSTNLESVRVKVNIATNEPIKNIYSPTHKIAINKTDDFHASVSYEENDVKPEIDFELFVSTSPDEVGLNMISYKASGEDGFFMLLAAPKVVLAKEEIDPKDVILVADTSGSMDGQKIEQTKKALKYILNHLNPLDKFNIITFSDYTKKYNATELQEVSTANIAEAIKFVDGLVAEGGTDINQSLADALAMIRQQDRTQVIMFLTDGEPTVGEMDPTKIVENVDANNKYKTRIFVFGVGNDVNTHLLDTIAQYGKAFSTYVSEEEDIEVKISDYYNKVSNPVLKDLAIAYNPNIEVYDMFPRELPDLFQGSQLVLFGRYKNPSSTVITLSGAVKGETKTFRTEANIQDENTKFDYLPGLWATRKIGFLLDQIRLKGESDELKNEVIKLSKKYGIITEYTSFLVDLDIPMTAEGEDDFITRAVPMMEETMKGVDFGATTGAGATESAINTQNLQQSQSLQESYNAPEFEEQAQKIQRVSNKTFYDKDGVWTDDAYTNQEATKVQFASDDYFKLLNASPELGKYFSQGKNVIACTDEKVCYEVVEEETAPIVIPQKTLEDISSHWAKTYIEKLVNLNVIKGYTENNKQLFRPNQPVTRAEFLKMVMEALQINGSPVARLPRKFADIQSTDWFAGYVETAELEGIVAGYMDNTFRPNNPVTRAEAVKIILHAAASYLPYDMKDKTEFSDVIGWQIPWVQAAADLKIVQGYGQGQFRPNQPITRAEAAKIISIVLDAKEKKDAELNNSTAPTTETTVPAEGKATEEEIDTYTTNF